VSAFVSASAPSIVIRVLAGGLLAGLAWAGTAFWPAPSAAQETAGKIPNFAPSSKVGWLAAGTGWISPPSGPGPVLNDKNYRYVPNNTGEQPTFRVADLDNPILQPWAREALKKVNERVLSGKDAFPPQVRCWPLGIPSFVLYPAQPIYIVQTPRQVIMTWQGDQMVRKIYLTDKHSENVKPSWFGESIGRYENGDTLAVDTIGLSNRTFVDNFRTPHTDKLHVAERFKLSADEKAIEVTVSVDDPGAFTTPWTAMQRFRRTEIGPMIEATCAEGNFNYYNFDLEPLPMANKPDF
jgi:hypothetical protein